MSGDPREARWRHLGVGGLGMDAACAVQHGLPYLTLSGHNTAQHMPAAVPVVLGRVAERPPVPAGVP